MSDIVAFPGLISHGALRPLVAVRVPNKIGIPTSDRAPCLYPNVRGINVLFTSWRREDKIVVKELFERWEKGRQTMRLGDVAPQRMRNSTHMYDFNFRLCSPASLFH